MPAHQLASRGERRRVVEQALLELPGELCTFCAIVI